jgi:nicotinate-nucleotide adenylyltransferase
MRGMQHRSKLRRDLRICHQSAASPGGASATVKAYAAPAVNVAVFGGSFNPPHIAHVQACALLLSIENVEHVLLVPTFKHPFAKPLAPFEQRVRMCEMATACFSKVTVSRIEEEIGGESLTLRTLERLKRARPEWSLRLVIGADVLAEAPRWHGFDEIVKIAPPIVLARAGGGGQDQGPCLLPDVSSTRVRDAVARGAWTELERWVPRLVLEHIRSEGLYRTPPEPPAPRAPK